MSFDRQTFLKLSQELEIIQKRESEIVAELAKLFASKSTPTPVDHSVKGSKPKAKAKKGQLQKVVVEVLASYAAPAPLAQIARTVAKKRPGTKVAAVASVLHGLARQGKVSTPQPNIYFYPVPTATTPAKVEEVVRPAKVMPKPQPEEILES